MQADGLAAGFIVVSAVVMTAVLAVANRPFASAKGGRRSFAFWPLALFLWASLNAIFLSNDFFNLYVGLELLSLSAVALVAVEGGRAAVAAALRYLLFALFGSLLYLAGAMLLYASAGALDIGVLSREAGDGVSVLVAAALMTSGLAVKTALFPFHAWLPPAHSAAPAPASAILSGLVPKASFYIALRLWFEALPDAASPPLLVILGALGSMAVVYGSLLALRQDRLKPIIAYSTVAQLGYLFLVFPLAGGEGAAQPWQAGAWTGAVFHAFSHATAKAAMFLAAGLLIQALGDDRLSRLDGAARAMPMTVFAFALSAVTLMGLPPSGGFIAKYLLVTSAFASGQFVWGAVLIGGGLLAALYLYRPLGRMMLPPPEAAAFAPVSRARQAVPLLLAGAAIALGVASAGPYDFLQIGRPGAAGEGLE